MNNLSIDNKLDMAINMCRDNKKRAARFSYIYPFSTENISSYLRYFQLDNNSLLTVGSSGDQVLNAILAGTKNITLLDICPFAQEYTYLKIATLLSLNREEYLNFLSKSEYPKFHINNKELFNIKTFEIIDSNLKEINEESSYFWNELYKRYSGSIIRKRLFSTDEYKTNLLIKLNNYLESDESYNNLKNKLMSININFKHEDIFTCNNRQKYDNIFLSNITTLYKLSDVVLLIDRLKENLNDNGKILISYLYEIDLYNIDNVNNNIYNINKALSLLPKDVKLKLFIGVNGLKLHKADIKDSVLIYKKIPK